MQARGVGSDAGEEAREVSGMTTRLAIAYVEEKAGRLGVERLLEGAGLSGREADLRDENRWFPDRFRVALFESAATVLGDPHVAERIGAAALNVNVGGGTRGIDHGANAGARLTTAAVREHRPRQRQVQPCPSNGCGRGGRQPRAAAEPPGR